MSEQSPASPARHAEGEGDGAAAARTPGPSHVASMSRAPGAHGSLAARAGGRAASQSQAGMSDSRSTRAHASGKHHPSGPRRPLRAVHTSDVHLGSYTQGTSMGDEHNALSAQAFMRVIDLANECGADLLLIAGDFFDNDRVPEEIIYFAAEEIDRFRGHTVICPGNHDAVDDGRIYWRHDLEAIAPRLHIIRDHFGETIDLPDLDAVIWGRAALDADWHFKPLHGIPERQDHRWHIAMAHGHYVRDDYDRHRSMLIEPEEISAAGEHWDYLALGHWDPHTDVSMGDLTALYSGAPLAFSDGHQVAGWAVVVDFDDHGVHWETHRVDPRERLATPAEAVPAQSPG